MFEKKEKNLLPEKDIFVETIPEDFYGGKNPVVSFKNVEESVDLKKNKEAKVTADEKKKFHEATAVGADNDWHLSNLVSSPKALAILAGSLFIVAILGTGSYYYIKNNLLNKGGEEITVVLPESPLITPAVTNTPVQEPIVEEVIPAIPTSTEPEAIKELSLEFPSVLLAESADLDSDGLTDLAEEEFQTDPGDFDTDKDKYPDGLEVYHLYNPKGFEPQKLIDSGLVKEYNNPNFTYQVYIPINWAVGNVDEEGRQVLFSTLSGENIELRVFDLNQNEDFAGWFARMAVSQDLNSLQDFTTVGKYSGKMRSDGLVYYFVYNGKVYVLLYHTTNSSVVNYKSVFSLVARSLNFDIFIPVTNSQESLVSTSTAVTSTETTETTTVTEENEIF